MFLLHLHTNYYHFHQYRLYQLHIGNDTSRMMNACSVTDKTLRLAGHTQSFIVDLLVLPVEKLATRSALSALD
jgi:hypothetical protein